MKRRVVVTGMGVITPLAVGLENSWKKLCAGESGIKGITQFDAASLRCQIAGEIRDFNELDFLEIKQARRTDRMVHFLLAATKMALEDGQFEVKAGQEYRTGIVAATAVGPCKTFEEGHELVAIGRMQKVSPKLIINLAANTAAGAMAAICGARGPHHFLQEACAAGTNAIGLGLRTIQYGKADVMIAGGAEAGICATVIASLDNLKALADSCWNEEPHRASRPFEKNRSGFVSSEGAGVLILEELKHARSRDAKIYAEVLGYGSTCDAYHMVAPLPSGESAKHCMELSIRDAGLAVQEIDYINAHGTATPANDQTETLAIKKLFGQRAKEIMISSNKSMIGHMWGAAGAVEAIFTAKALQEGIIPPTINLEERDPKCDLDYVPLHKRISDIGIALSNSFGFGGINGSIVLKKYDQ